MADLTDIEVLLVEDNPDDAELILRALEKSDLTHKLHHVDDGAKALDFMFGSGVYAMRYAAPLPRVVLLDLKLPKVDGLEVLRRLKSDSRTRRVPIVVLTSSNEPSDIGFSYDFGTNSYIVKPVDFAELTAIVSAVGAYWLAHNQIPSTA